MLNKERIKGGALTIVSKLAVTGDKKKETPKNSFGEIPDK